VRDEPHGRFNLLQHIADGDAAVLRLVARKSPACLLELARTRHRAAPSSLIPGDGDVDEPLEEVTLLGGGGSPGELERLVRGEEVATPHQLEPARGLRVTAHDADSRAKPWYAPPVATILLAGVDLFFRGKLEALLPGHRFVTTDTVDAPELVIADISRIDADEVADAYPDIPIVGFTNHTDTGGLRAARAAGFDQVVAKSALVERAPVLIEELLASVE
jgi:hypothetical protein